MKTVESKIGRKYGWKRSLPNFKLKKYGEVLPAEVIVQEQLPDVVDLRSQCQPVYDQGQLGSCSANAMAGAIEFLQQGFQASRLFIYYNERALEGSIGDDSGAELTDGIETVITTGVCSETEWPYDITQFTVQPPAQCYLDAKNDIFTQYLQVNGQQEMQSCLAQGFPFVFGFSVYESFEGSDVASTGIVHLPKHSEQCLGGHAVLCCGYKQINGVWYFIVKNSWGTGWGDQGFFYLPFDYMTNQNLASEQLTLRK